MADKVLPFIRPLAQRTNNVFEVIFTVNTEFYCHTNFMNISITHDIEFATHRVKQSALIVPAISLEQDYTVISKQLVEYHVQLHIFIQRLLSIHGFS